MEKFCLSNYGISSVKYILTIIAKDFPQIQVCPVVPSITALLLHHLSPADTLASVRFLIKTSINSDDWLYFPTTIREHTIFVNSLGSLVEKQCPKLYNKMKQLNPLSVTENPFWITWVSTFCTGIFSVKTSLRLLDSFVCEGYKVLFRYIVAVLLIKSNDFMNCNTLEEMEALSENLYFTTANGDDELISKKAHSFSFSRGDIKRFSASYKTKLGKTDSDSYLVDINTIAKTMPLCDQKSLIIIDDVYWQYIWTWIPQKYRSQDVKLIFSNEQDGSNLSMLYSNCKSNPPHIMLIQTTKGDLFGAFLTDSWENNKPGSFFGNGDSNFIF
jgi:hypothetical protein